MDYAKFKGLSISDALKSSVVKSTLTEKEEQRKTAKATNTGGGKRGSSKVSGENLHETAKDTGKLPESDADMDKMLEARYS